MVRQAALVVCILVAHPLFAQEESTERLDPLKPSSWEIAPEVSHFRYAEPGVMKDEGTLFGIVGSYTRRHLRSGDPTGSDIDSNDSISWSTFKIEGRLSFGQVDYDGSYMDGTPLRTSGTDDFLLDFRLLWGREWQPVELPDAFYLGLGYRYLNDNSSGQPGGYMRESNYLYVPLGSHADFELATAWTLGLTGEFDVLLIGRQISHLDDTDSGSPEVRNWQWPGFGIRGAVAVQHKGESLDLALSPFVRYWWIAESDTSGGYYEPENNTLEYGLSAIIRF
jgi:hypothetical protein